MAKELQDSSLSCFWIYYTEFDSDGFWDMLLCLDDLNSFLFVFIDEASKWLFSGSWNSFLNNLSCISPAGFMLWFYFLFLLLQSIFVFKIISCSSSIFFIFSDCFSEEFLDDEFFSYFSFPFIFLWVLFPNTWFFLNTLFLLH